MRKLTGYIGAMIIVIALMGSILAGYALNINGTSTVMNEYEKVTDVSGLYTHSQEPSYIEYNPASNYIGYGIEQAFYENVATNTAQQMKKMVDGDTITITTSGITFDGKNYSLPNVNCVVFASSWGYVYFIPSNPGIYWTSSNGDYYVSTITLTWSANSLTVSNSSDNYSRNTGIAPSFYYPYDDYDMVGGERRELYYNINNSQTTLMVGGINPRYNNNNIYVTGTPNWVSYRCFPYGDEVTVPGGVFHWENDQQISNNVNKGLPTIDVTYSGSFFENPWFVVSPRYVYASDPLGINYTESNRVNNYLINTEPANTIKISSKIDLMSISAADQWDTPGNILAATIIANHSTPPYPTWSFFTPNYTNSYGGGEAAVKNDIVIYKLSDVLSTYTIPNGTQTVKIDFNSTDTRPYTFYGNTWYLDGNVAFFQKLTEPYNYYENKNIANEKLYGVYDPSTNLVSVYQPNGILEYTETPDNIGVLFVKPNQIYGRFQYHESVNGNYYTEPYTMANRQNPFVTMTSSVYNPANNHYMDITKGISIKSTNVVDTNWNNEYSNGKIQILFRAETTPGTYHNTLTIGDNVISVDYNTNKYLVTLNGNDPVDIGTWRNIVLNVDLINGELSAIPVRTFNSYTNVELDNTNIFIGNLVNAAPTNIIKWAPTTDSLTFNVYSTSVFMNTYGVVMVDPTLNITDYFTTLDNFYQLRLSNFSMYGQSMTINGVTGTVTGNTISFNDKTIQIKDMTITYADGHAYISDSHATIDLGEITDNNISMSGAWYFITDLMRGYTTEKMIYEWDWQDFILDNVQFCIIYIGLALIGLLIARRYCTLTITDYALFLVSIVIALTVQVIA